MQWNNKRSLAGFAEKCNGKNDETRCVSCKRFDKGHYTTYYADLRGSCINYQRRPKEG